MNYVCVVATDAIKPDANAQGGGDDGGGGGGSVIGAKPVITPDADTDLNQVVLPILVIACNRPSIKTNLDEILRYVVRGPQAGLWGCGGYFNLLSAAVAAA